MKLFKSITILILISFMFTGIIKAQICGDANDDTDVNVEDLIATLNYLTGTNLSINLANADCDGITDITVGDLSTLSDNIFMLGSLNCNPSGSYSYSPANDDTLHIVRLIDVPANVDEVYLTVLGSFSDSTDGIFMPLHGNGTGSSNLFSINSFQGLQYSLSGGTVTGPNNSMVYACPITYPSLYNGSAIVTLVKYVRADPGVGSILPEAYDDSTPRLVTINRNNDLYAPVIAYHDYTYPDGILRASVHDFTFNAFTDSPSPDTFTVDILFADLGVDYKLTSPTSWIQIDQTTGTTPATVTLTADATGLGPLDYNGVIRVYYNNISPKVDSINLTLSVHPPIDPTYPPGDLNCDGSLNILDLNFLVNYFFRLGPVPAPCEK